MADIKTELNLNSHNIRELKEKLHNLKPTIVIDDKGLTEEIFQEIDHALNKDELIKIRTHTDSSEELSTIAEKICHKVKATLIQILGYIIAIYRKNVQPEE
ncbi:MAG: YhbY family RNA-binding protein [Coxiellaceae bacterium]|jgi:putative YhbY family RNA-binding protein|nr:YhbY family RNA-binding protein [Coxiellaceae bacterium]